MATSVQITSDCADPDRLATFWAAALGYEKQAPPPGYATWPAFLAAHGVPEDEWTAASAVVDPASVGPRLFFQRVPEPKAVRNRVHLDVNVGGGSSTPLEERQARVNATSDRLTRLGATRVEDHHRLGEFLVVMRDPEGNEFCLQ